MLSRKYLLLYSGLFFALNVFAQSKLSMSGKVTDAKTGEPLASASIYFPDLRTGTTCNSEGIYTVFNLAAGKYLVEVSHLGYASHIETVELGNNSQKDFKLDSTVVENEGVTVTGVSSATSIKRTPAPVSIIRKDDLFRNVSTNLIDNLARTPGVTQVTTGPAISKPVIRGLGYNRVVVVNDGIRQEGQQWGDEHGIEIDEQNVTKVEIMKGPASLMYGSDALAGVINVISFLPPGDGKIKGNISGGYFTNNRQRNFHADIGGNKNGFTWGLNASSKAASDYKNKYDGYVFNSKFNEKNFGGYFGLNKNWGYTHLYITKFDQRLGLPEGERDSTTGKFLKRVNNGGIAVEEIVTDAEFKSTDPLLPEQRIQHLKIAAESNFIAGKNRITFVTGYQQNRRQEFGNILIPDEKSLFFDLGTVNYNLQFHFVEKNNFKTTIGINGMYQSGRNKGAEQLIPEYVLFDIGGFVYTQKRMDKLTLSGGLRFDNRFLDSKELLDASGIKFTAFKKNFSNISGSAGLTYESSKTMTLKFNLARGFRSPNISELASNGAHEGTNRFEYGEKNLKSETSLQADAGIVINNEHLSFTANIFYNPINNFIFYRKLSAVGGGDSLITDGGETFFAFRFNQGNAKLFGFEFNLDIHPHPLDWLHFENTFSWVRGLLNLELDGSKNLPNIPSARFVNEIKVELFKKGKTIHNVFIKAELDHSFSQQHSFTGYNTESATKGYSLLHAGFGGEVRKKDKPVFTIFIGANNIFDVSYQNHLSRLKYAPENMTTGRMGVYNMGRNFSIKLNMPLDFSGSSK